MTAWRKLKYRWYCRWAHKWQYDYGWQRKFCSACEDDRTPPPPFRKEIAS